MLEKHLATAGFKSQSWEHQGCPSDGTSVLFPLALRTQKVPPVCLAHERLVPGSVAPEGSEDLWTQLHVWR